MLVSTIDDWKQALDEDKLVGSVMLDFSKAFDTFSHSTLLRKLNSYGGKGNWSGSTAIFLEGSREFALVLLSQLGVTYREEFLKDQSWAHCSFTLYVNDLPLAEQGQAVCR